MNIKKYRNIGGIDRAIRTVITVIMIYYGFIETSLIGQPLVSNLVGIMGILNGIFTVIGICPAYTLAGISTCPKSQS